MKLIKKFLCTFMVIVFLTLSIGSSYLDANHMTKVNAVSEVVVAAGITAASLFEICLFVGCVVVTCYAVGEIIENEDDIARIGKNAIDKLGDITDQLALTVTDASGQVYQIGSQALKRIQDTDWEVIQGGKGNHDDDSGDKGSGGPIIDLDDKTKFKLSAWFSAMLASIMGDDYQESVNGNPSSLIYPILSRYVTDYDIAAQWSGNPFLYTSNFGYTYDNWNGYHNNKYEFSSLYNFPFVAFIDSIYIYFLAKVDNGITDYYLYGKRDDYINGELIYSGELAYYHAVEITLPDAIDSYFYSNFLVFPNETVARAYLKGTGSVTDALNYAQIYRNADWLSDDWAGQLIDPLTNIGLSLSQLIDLMKALGLHAIGNNLTPEELLDLIEESLPAVNPDLLPGHIGDPAIEPDPDKPTIYYPYPGAWPDPDPGTGPDPGIDPDPGTDPDDPSGGDKEDPGNDPDTDRQNGTWVVDLSKYFPFCIPFDLIHLLEALDAEPQAPCFEFPLKIPAYGVDHTFVVDLAMFDTVAAIFRTFETLLFILGLILLTRNLIRG